MNTVLQTQFRYRNIIRISLFFLILFFFPSSSPLLCNSHSLSFLLSVSLSYPSSLSISDDNLNITLTAGNLANLKWREGEKRLSPAAGGMRSRSEPVDGCEDDDDHC